MTNKIYIKTGSDWVDVTGTYVAGFTFLDNGKSALNTLTVTFKRNLIETTENPTYDKEIKWEKDGTAIFAGRIDKPTGEFPYLTISAFSYGAELLDKFVNAVYENKTVEYIAQDVIETDTSLTYASTGSFGITIDLIPFRDKKKNEVLSILSEIVGATFWTDPNKNAYFEKSGVSNSGLTLTVGSNVINQPKWDYNTSNVIKKIIVEGGTQEFTTEQTFNGTDTGSFTYEPTGNIKVTSDGVEINPTVQGTTTGSYTVNAESKSITFDATGTYTVTYSYAVPIRVSQIASNSFTNKELKIKNKSIKSYTEARKIGRQVLSLRQSPSKSTKCIIPGFDSGLKSNYLITVVDDNETDSSGNSINESFLIEKVKYVYPNNVTEISVGTNEYLIYDLIKDIDSKLRELAQEEGNQNIVQNYRYFLDNVEISITHRIVRYLRNVNDSWIWGQAVWGTTKWGDRKDGDNFTSYGSYTIEDYWSSTGSFSVSGNVLNINGTGTYKGRDGSGSYKAENVKCIVEYNKKTSNNFYVYFRNLNNDNYYRVDFNHLTNNVTLGKNVSGSFSEVSSGSFTFTGTHTFYTRVVDSNIKVWSTSTIITTTDSDLSGTGHIKISSNGNSSVNKIQILKGD